MISRVAFEVAAERLLDKHGVTTPPVPVERIAELEGIEIVASHSAGLESGFAFRDGDRRVIGVNTRESRRRRRFTVGHEIGHLLLHERELTVDQAMRVHKRGVSSMATNREEIEANGFAAALLMPGGLLAVAARAQLSRSTSRRLTRRSGQRLGPRLRRQHRGHVLSVGQPRDALPLILCGTSRGTNRVNEDDDGGHGAAG